MHKSEYRNIFQNEDDHFFYKSTHKLVLELVRKYGPARPRILDAGCGTGGLLKKLEKLGDCEGIDFSGEAIKLAKRRGLKAKLGSIEKLPYRNSTFNVITSIDVLVCHEVGNDLRALTELSRVLKPGGILIMRVSANKSLRLAHDTHVHSIRRYNLGELLELLRSVGYIALFSSYMNTLLLIPVLLKLLLEKIFVPVVRSNISHVGTSTNSLLAYLLTLENTLLIRGIRLPVGVGIIIVAKKIDFHK